MNFDFSLISVLNFLFIIFALLVSLSIHESAHAFVADKRGDPTGKMLGRISLNPLRHLDLIGSIILPLILAVMNLPVFGWAKPVPVNPRNFRNYRIDNALVSSAGPISNFILALIMVFFMALYLFIVKPQKFYSEINEDYSLPNLLLQVASINFLLMAFNILPIFPLDGSHVFEAILPKGRILQSYEKIKPFGFLILLFLIMTPTLSVLLEYVINISLRLFVFFPLALLSNILE